MDRREFIVTCALATSAIATVSMATESVPAWPEAVPGSLEYYRLPHAQLASVCFYSRTRKTTLSPFKITKSGKIVSIHDDSEAGTWDQKVVREAALSQMDFLKKACRENISESQRMFVVMSNDGPSWMGIVCYSSESNVIVEYPS